MRRYRTWTVFSIGLLSLMGLMLVPSLTAIRRGEQIYRDIRNIQEDYDRNQRTLDEVARALYLTSITLREFMLDTSDENDRKYASDLEAHRAELAARIGALRQMASQTDVVRRLEREVEGYWTSVEPVLAWSPKQRSERGTYFLRQEQRPRRQSIMAIADEIGKLNRTIYRAQYEKISRGERIFRDEMRRTMFLVFLAGLAVSGASILRIAWLERKSAEQHRAAERAGEELRLLSIQLRHAQEEERKTISRELHDEVGQKLTALRMELGGLERLRGEEFRERVADLKSLAEQSLRITRDISAGLHPSLLDDLGLGPALQKQARQFANVTGTPVDVELSGTLDNLPERHRIYIYRIVQESLTNCARHAKASRITIRLDGGGGQLNLSIADNGAGFAPGAYKGLGLVGMEERVRELKGTMTIDSKPGGGTRVAVSLPV